MIKNGRGEEQIAGSLAEGLLEALKLDAVEVGGRVLAWSPEGLDEIRGLVFLLDRLCYKWSQPRKQCHCSPRGAGKGPAAYLVRTKSHAPVGTTPSRAQKFLVVNIPLRRVSATCSWSTCN